MALLSDFRFLVAPEVEGAANLIIDRSVLGASREFCDDTHSWRHEHSSVMLIDGIEDYALDDLPLDSEVIWVNSVIQGTHAVISSNQDNLNRFAPHTTAQTGSLAERFYMINGDTFRAVPKPTGLTLVPITPNVVLRPLITSTSLPDYLLNEYGEAIAAGALSKLMLQPGKAWTNPDYAAVHQRIFKQKKTEAKRRTLAGHTQFNDTIQPGSSFI